MIVPCRSPVSSGRAAAGCVVALKRLAVSHSDPQTVNLRDGATPLSAQLPSLAT